MAKFFGRELDFSGTEILVKLGTKYPDTGDPRHYTDWRDGQVVDIAPLGMHVGKRIGYSLAVIKLPNIAFPGKGEANWKHSTAPLNNFSKFFKAANEHGKYKWETSSNIEFTPKRKRDYYVDFNDLLSKGAISPSEYLRLYEFWFLSEPIVLSSLSLGSILKHEDVSQRTSQKTDKQHASIAAGTYTIGAAGDYATINAFEADMDAQLTGNLTAEHLSEETAMSSGVDFTVDTNSYLLKITAYSGAEHNGGAYGNGARINFGTGTDLRVIDSANTLADFEISKLALDASGSGNDGVLFRDGAAGTGEWLINRLLIKTDSNTDRGIYQNSDCRNDTYIRNCIIYGGAAIGIRFDSSYTNVKLYNCTSIKNVVGIYQYGTGSFGGSLYCYNNFEQGSTSSGYSDAGTGWGTHDKNISEDATSPDASYRSLNCHDATSCFLNYTSDDYRISSSGTEINTVKAGQNLTAQFTDDINGSTRTSTEFFIGADWIELSSVDNSGSGAVSIPLLTVAGSGTNTPPSFSGSGAVSLPLLTVAGAGYFPVDNSGTGDISIPLLTVAGSGTNTDPTFSGSGAVSLPAITVDGIGNLPADNTGDGAVSIPLLTVSGSGTATVPTFSGTGDINIPIIMVAGVGDLVQKYAGTGTINIPLVEVAGTGITFIPTFTGSGAITLPAIICSGRSGTGLGVTYNFPDKTDCELVDALDNPYTSPILNPTVISGTLYSDSSSTPWTPAGKLINGNGTWYYFPSPSEQGQYYPYATLHIEAPEIKTANVSITLEANLVSSGTAYFATPGSIGRYNTKTQWYKLGKARNRVYEFNFSAPVKWVITRLFIEVE